MAEIYTLINAWHIIAGGALLILSHFLIWRMGDAHGYFRVPSDLRKRAESAEVQCELAEGREKATERALTERLTALEADYAQLRGAATNLAWVAAQRKGGKT